MMGVSLIRTARQAAKRLARLSLSKSVARAAANGSLLERARDF